MIWPRAPTIRDAPVGETNPSRRPTLTPHPPICSLSQAASLLVAGVVALNASPALALNAIELTDQRVTNKEGLQLIYEVRAGPTPRFHPTLRNGVAPFFDDRLFSNSMIGLSPDRC